MDAPLQKESSTAKREIVIERVFDVPAEKLWKAIIDVDQMRQWYMPQLQSFTAETGFETQFTVSHNGKDFLHLWKITEVIPGKKITYSWRYAGYPGVSFVTFELFPMESKTGLKLTHAGLESFQPEANPDLARENFVTGWTSIMAALQKFSIEIDRLIILSRIFDAPRELVWEAWTNPEHVAQWWGPNGFTTTIKKMDFRVGGVWKLVMHGPDGTDYPNSSIFREIVEHERIVFSHGGRSEDGPSSNFLATWTFEAQGKQTRVTMQLLFNTPEERELVIRAYGAIEGGKQTLARLAAYLPQIKGNML